MRAPSKRVVRQPVHIRRPPMPLAGRLFLLGLAALVLCAIVYPPVGAALVLLAAAFTLLVRLPGFVLALPSLIERAMDPRRALHALRRRSALRAGQSICQFVRSFDVRRTDPWVLRAVYEELQNHLSWVSPDFPVHADDAIGEDLLIDPDDLDMDIVWSIAARARRSLEHVKRNPFYLNVVTVRDLVSFFLHQPRMELAPEGEV